MESVNENDEEENSVTKSSVSQSEQMQRLKSVGLELWPINQQIKSRWFCLAFDFIELVSAWCTVCDQTVQ